MALAGKPLPLAPARAPRRPPRHHAVASRPAHPRAEARRGKATARRTRASRRVAARPLGADVQALAGDAGVVTALLLAPLESGQID
jgi:hypothetical protein